MNTLLDHSPDLIYFKDSDSRFVRISDTLARHLGVESTEELIHKTDSDSSRATSRVSIWLTNCESWHRAYR